MQNNKAVLCNDATFRPYVINIRLAPGYTKEQGKMQFSHHPTHDVSYISTTYQCRCRGIYAQQGCKYLRSHFHRHQMALWAIEMHNA